MGGLTLHSKHTIRTVKCWLNVHGNKIQSESCAIKNVGNAQRVFTSLCKKVERNKFRIHVLTVNTLGATWETDVDSDEGWGKEKEDESHHYRQTINTQDGEWGWRWRQRLGLWAWLSAVQAAACLLACVLKGRECNTLSKFWRTGSVNVHRMTDTSLLHSKKWEKYMLLNHNIQVICDGKELE